MTALLAIPAEVYLAPWKESDMYGIPGHVPGIHELRARGFSSAPIYPQIDTTEDALDFELAATFPASDALSITQPGGGWAHQGRLKQ